MQEKRHTIERRRGFRKSIMHEVSIALSLIEVVSDQCLKGGYRSVDAVNVKIGRASGIMPDALLFAFDVVKADTIARNAALNIEEVPVSGRCRECGSGFTVEEEYVVNCPVCHGVAFDITTGRELDIVDMDVS